MQDSSLIIFCFPCAGASATSYLKWRRLVPSWLRIEPVEPPGRGARMGEKLIHDFNCLVENLTDRLAPQAAEQKYALFGHSMGALLAHGCAAKLVGRGAPGPVALAVAAAAAPSRRRLKNAIQKSETDLLADLRRFNGAPELLFQDPKMLAFTLEVMSADYDVCDSLTLTSAGKLTCPIFVYGGTKDAISRADLTAWRDETSMRTSVTMFEGGHFFLRENEKTFLQKLVSDFSFPFSAR
jgi:surfactin synthase thioesterase subunit